MALTADGNIIVGADPIIHSGGFIWDASGGTRDLRQVFVDAGIPMNGWTSIGAVGISSDGRRIAGTGVHDDKDEAWLAKNDVLADLNVDWTVNIFDINLVSANWNEAGPAGDANGDGIVNIFDINAISANWTDTSGSAAVPEPSTVALALCAVALITLPRALSSANGRGSQAC